MCAEPTGVFATDEASDAVHPHTLAQAEYSRQGDNTTVLRSPVHTIQYVAYQDARHVVSDTVYTAVAIVTGNVRARAILGSDSRGTCATMYTAPHTRGGCWSDCVRCAVHAQADALFATMQYSMRTTSAVANEHAVLRSVIAASRVARR